MGAEGDKRDEGEPKQPEQAPPAEASSAEDEAVRARRRLLKLTAYSAPVVLGTVLLSKDALAQQQSCTPATCSPRCQPRVGCNPNNCPPDGAPCGPSNCKPRN